MSGRLAFVVSQTGWEFDKQRRPGAASKAGHYHVLKQVLNESVFLSQRGFAVQEAIHFPIWCAAADKLTDVD